MDKKAIREGYGMVKRARKSLTEAHSSYCFTCADVPAKQLMDKVREGIARMQAADKAGEFENIPKRKRSAQSYIKTGNTLIQALSKFRGALADVEDSV